MKILSAIFFLFVCVSCVSNAKVHDASTDDRLEIVNIVSKPYSVVYVKDKKTNLCWIHTISGIEIIDCKYFKKAK